MIDYKQFQKAQELIKEYAKLGNAISIELSNATGKFKYWIIRNDRLGYEAENIEEVISDLQALMKPKNKYKVGQTVYFVDENKLSSGVINEIRDFCGKNLYYFVTYDDEFTLGESLLYPSRQDLIDAQIEYWRRLACACDSVPK